MQSTSALCFDPAQTCIPLSHHIKYSTTWSSLAGGLTGSGNTEDAPVKAAGFSQPSTLPSTQACGAGRALEPQSSTTICPHQEGQEVLVQTANDCSHPALCPFYRLDTFRKRTGRFLSLSPVPPFVSASSFLYIIANTDCGKASMKPLRLEFHPV